MQNFGNLYTSNNFEWSDEATNPEAAKQQSQVATKPEATKPEATKPSNKEVK